MIKKSTLIKENKQLVVDINMINDYYVDIYKENLDLELKKDRLEFKKNRMEVLFLTSVIFNIFLAIWLLIN